MVAGVGALCESNAANVGHTRDRKSVKYSGSLIAIHLDELSDVIVFYGYPVLGFSLHLHSRRRRCSGNELLC